MNTYPPSAAALPGRGTGLNPPNRFERLRVEPDPDADPAERPHPRTQFYIVAGGQAEREKQKEYEERAKRMNHTGFTSIAATLRSMAEQYKHSAERAEKSNDPDL